MAVEGHIATGDTIAGYEVEELVGGAAWARSTAPAIRGSSAASR